MAPPKMSTGYSQEPENMLPYLAKEILQMRLRLWVLRWGDYLGLVEWMKSDHKTLKSREAREMQHAGPSAPLSALRKEERAVRWDEDLEGPQEAGETVQRQVRPGSHGSNGEPRWPQSSGLRTNRGPWLQMWMLLAFLVT